MRSPHNDLYHLIQCNINTLSSAATLLEQVSEQQYTHTEQPAFESSLGKHLRHVLDHYFCFFRDLQTDVIDYDVRDRNVRLEDDRQYAIQMITSVCDQLTKLAEQDSGDQVLQVRLCNDVGLPEGETTQSSIRRELQFLQGHAVHHYALMAAMLRFYGVSVSREFGIAPSTLVHENQEASDTTAAISA